MAGKTPAFLIRAAISSYRSSPGLFHSAGHSGGHPEIRQNFGRNGECPEIGHACAAHLGLHAEIDRNIFQAPSLAYRDLAGGALA
ncbi:MAG: hypothetical protein ACLQVJ_28065 [Syntrophobacteraceae bacterium]